MNHRTDDDLPADGLSADSLSADSPLSADDPRLTAYALGAMEPEEAAAFEALLDDHRDAADLRAEIEAIRALAGDLEHEFAADGDAASDGLDAGRRASVLAGASANAPASDTPEGTATLRVERSGWTWGLAALAASLLVGIPLVAFVSEDSATYRKELAAEAPFDEGATTAAIDPHAYQDGQFTGYDADGSTTLREQDGPARSENWNRVFHEATGEDKEDAQPTVRRRPEGASGPYPGPGGSLPPGLREPVDPSAPPPAPPSGAPTTPQPTTGTILYADTGGKTKKSAPWPAGGSQAGGGGGGHTTLGGIGVAGGGSGGSVQAVDPSAIQAGSAPGVRLLGMDGKPLAGQPGYGHTYFGYVAGGQWANWNAQTHGEHYVHPGIDGFMHVSKRGGHTSTFSVDVDSASYTNVRRMLNAGQRPHPAAIRIEEFVNYFDYGYAAPADDVKQPFAQHIQVAACPWNPKHRLARIALKGKEIQRDARPPSNLVFLVDVSGSMQGEDKLPLLQSGLEMLAENLDARDRVSIVTYASSATLALESTTGDQRDAIVAKIRSLKAGGSTNGAGGIQLAYAEAQKHFLKEGTNRVILCTDGDFNVGVSDGPGLTKLVHEKAKGGVYLSVLGFGTGNLQDGKMEAYSNAGNGNYAYIDGLAEAKRVLVEQMEGTLITIAKDVKFQVWFNPKTVHAWRLLGYENRRLAARDFNDDSKDAGDIGAGHEVTALYELVPTGVSIPGTVDPNPFVDGSPQEPTKDAAAPAKDEPRPKEDALFVWRLRYKQPDGDTSALVEQNVFDEGLGFEQADRDFQWAAGVTAFGMLLRHSPHRGQASYALVEELAAPAKGEDPKGRRAEFLGLVKKAQGR